MITSPITGGATKPVGSIKTDFLIRLYERYSDVRRFFTGLSEVTIHECLDTGYRFYQPFSTAGDGKFYEDLSREPLYYIPWKEEHTIASQYVQPGNKVFEQGCANGDFLVALREQKKVECYGSELNDAAVKTATKRGVSFSSITDADVVCSFQVLEHIADVRSFINEAITAAKPGGYIIFSVPNNDSFLKDDDRCFLNMPPHHMGLWTPAIFEQLPGFYPLDTVTIHTETLQPNHYEPYYHTYVGSYLRPLGIIGKVINKIIYLTIAKPIIKRRAQKITGHTLVAVFKKRA